MLLAFSIVILLCGNLGILTTPVFAQPTGGPIARFDWGMPDRFGQDRDKNGIIDYDYSPQYIHPSSGYTVNFDACSSSSSAIAGRVISYSWRITGNQISVPVDSGNSCKMVKNLGLGTYTVTLTVKAQNGQANEITKNVIVKDLLLVSIGESYASGEGNPDRAQRHDSFGFVKAGPVWQDKRCHRSTGAGPAQRH